MTRKDYQALATAIGRGIIVATDHGATPEDGAAAVAEAIISELAAENRQFDPARFRDWVAEIVAGQRNAYTGKKVTA